jgi:HAD superfamily hydrolase (TIGR01490 family)
MTRSMPELVEAPVTVEPVRRPPVGALATTTKAAAFFDLDRTLISRPTPLALAATFRRHGLLRPRDLVKASLWQILFALPGVDGARHASVEGMKLLKGLPVATLEEILAEAMESVLRPLLFAGPLDLLARHHSAGQRAYILSASLHEIVQHVADDLGFDGAAGSTCEIIDGVYTGKSLRPLYGEYKAAALRELAAAADIDVAASTGYSDSASDLPFLEAVGSPVAVNPDRKLRRIAKRRSWPIIRFEQLV